MPSHDFGSPEYVCLLDGEVKVESISLSRQKEFIALEKKNRSMIDEFRITIDNYRTLHSFGIFVGDVPVGEISVWRMVRSEPCLSFWVDERFRRQGVAFSAVSLVRDFVFDRYEFPVLVAHVLVNNSSSKHLLSKLGFVLDGNIVFDTVGGMKVHDKFVLRRNDASV